MMTSNQARTDTPTLLNGVRQIADSYDGFILDLWGVVHDGDKPLPGVIDCLTQLRAHNKHIVILSNAPRRADDVKSRLDEIGIPRGLYHAVMTSGEETWQHLKDRRDPWYAKLGRTVYHMGPARDRGMLDGLDLNETTDIEKAEAILNTGSYMDGDALAAYEPALVVAAKRKLPMICANPDLEVIHRGKRQICAGAIAKRYEELAGEVRWHGKPYPSVYQTCFGLFGSIAKNRIIAVGDSLRTDIAGANGAGISSLFVTGGIHAVMLGIEEGTAPSIEALAKHYSEWRQTPTAAIAGFQW